MTDLADLADKLLGYDGVAFAREGRECRDVARSLQSARRAENQHAQDRANAIVATAYWAAAIRSKQFAALLQGSAAPPCIVVCHGREGAPRYDLVVLSKISDAVIRTFEVPPDDLSSSLKNLGRKMIIAPRRYFRPLPWDGIARAVIEASAMRQFGVAFVEPPKVDPAQSHVPTPGRAIIDPATTSISTVGIVCVNASGKAGVTGASHAVQDDCPQVDGTSGNVVSRDLISDSCFIDGDVLCSCRPCIGPLTVGPRHAEPCSFEGVGTAALVNTIVNGWTPDILVQDPALQRRVFTPRVTTRGDSGAALLNKQGEALGFLFGQTGFGEQAEFSSWIWAESVFQYHQIVYP